MNSFEFMVKILMSYQVGNEACELVEYELLKGYKVAPGVVWKQQ
jgi:hypothetical protein